MGFRTRDAEEVTQEVLVKVVTRLGTFTGESVFRTSLYRIVANHVLNMKQRAAESLGLTFTQLGRRSTARPSWTCPT
jgi:DNA-directed RNA polymerase specialized sigma24 family protein